MSAARFQAWQDGRGQLLVIGDEEATKDIATAEAAAEWYVAQFDRASLIGSTVAVYDGRTVEKFAVRLLLQPEKGGDALPVEGVPGRG